MAISAWLPAGEARAANGAYAVDAADTGEAGSCKVESWRSSASNTDFTAVANPSCVVNPFQPVELSMLTSATIRFPVPGGKPEHHRTGHL